MLFPFSETFALGAVAQNLANPDGAIPSYLELPAKLGLGLYYVYLQKFHLRADITQAVRRNSHKQVAYSIGIDSRFMEFLAFRMGYHLDNLTDRHVLTAGIGFLGPRLSLSYGYQVENQNGSGSRHVLDVQMPF